MNAGVHRVRNRFAAFPLPPWVRGRDARARCRDAAPSPGGRQRRGRPGPARGLRISAPGGVLVEDLRLALRDGDGRRAAHPAHRGRDPEEERCEPREPLEPARPRRRRRRRRRPPASLRGGATSSSGSPSRSRERVTVELRAEPRAVSPGGDLAAPPREHADRARAPATASLRPERAAGPPGRRPPLHRARLPAGHARPRAGSRRATTRRCRGFSPAPAGRCGRRPGARARARPRPAKSTSSRSAPPPGRCGCTCSATRPGRAAAPLPAPDRHAGAAARVGATGTGRAATSTSTSATSRTTATATSSTSCRSTRS